MNFCHICTFQNRHPDIFEKQSSYIKTLKKKPEPACCSFTFLKFFHQILSCNMMTVQMGLISKGSKNFLISGVFSTYMLSVGMDCSKIKILHVRLSHTRPNYVTTARERGKQWVTFSGEFSLWSFSPSNKRINQTKSEVNNVNLFLLLVEGRLRELKCTTTTHKTAAFNLAHVYQYTSYWIHNYIIRYNCICYGLVWQPNEAVIKELAVPLMRE